MTTMAVASTHVENSKPKYIKSNLRAYKIRIEQGTIKEEKFYARAVDAHRMATIACKTYPLSKVDVFENVGKETWVQLATYECANTSDPTHQGNPKKRTQRSSACARGNTQDQRWKDAMARTEVPVILRRNGAKLSDMPHTNKVEMIQIVA